MSATFAAAFVLSRGLASMAIVGVAAAALFLCFRVRADVALGTLGVALAIATRAGGNAAALSLVLGGALSALLAAVGVEALLGGVRARLRAVVASALVVGAVVLVARSMLELILERAAVAEPARAFGGDVVALAVVMSFEASAARRSPTTSVAFPLVSASLSLPLSFRQAARAPRLGTVALVFAAFVAVLSLSHRALAVVALITLSLSAARQLRRHAHALQLVDHFAVAAIAIGFCLYRPAVVVLAATVGVAAIASRASSRPDSNPDPT